MLLPGEHHTTRVLQARGIWEVGIGTQVLWHVSDGDLFVDVGAQFGYYTLLAALQGVRVIAIEPRSECVDIIGRNIRYHHVMDKAKVLQAVVSAPGVGGHVDRAGNFAPGRDKTVTLDEVLKGHSPSLIKIDIEGCECDALSGATEVLAEHHPVLIIEVHSRKMQALGRSPDDLLELLHSLGYVHRSIGAYSWTSTVDDDMPGHILCTHIGQTVKCTKTSPTDITTPGSHT
jgi:FkbM family methyltransferase